MMIRLVNARRATGAALRWASVFVYALGLFLLSNSASAKGYAMKVGVPDPVSHGFLYLGLGILLYWALRGRVKAPFSPLWASITVVLGTLYALSDELHQSFIIGRDADMVDFLSDVGGLLLAVVLVFLLGQARPIATSPDDTKRPGRARSAKEETS